MLLGFLSGALMAIGQPANDACKDAAEIVVPDQGFAVGHFTGTKVFVDDATREVGEKCDQSLHDLGNCDKTIWYKFSIATTRDVSVTLSQTDSAIPQIFAGFTVYRVENCDYHQGNISEQLVPLAKFGSSGNKCLNNGTYYIQVSAKSRAMGELWVELDVQKRLAETYDDHRTPYDFGLLVNKRKEFAIDYTCLSVEPEELSVAPGKEFSKSGWMRVGFPSNSINSYIDIYANPAIYAYRLFYGQPTMDSLKSTKPFIRPPTEQGYQARIYEKVCETVDTAVYVQFLFNASEGGIWVYTAGYVETKDDWNTPDKPLKIDIYNGYKKTFEKYLDCSGFLADHKCKNVIPEEYLVYFPWADVTDTLTYASYIVFDSKDLGLAALTYRDARGYSYALAAYLYEGNVEKDCNLTEIWSGSISSGHQFCLDSGVYTLVLVRESHTSSGNYIKLDIKKTRQDQNIRHYSHTDPWFIGNVRPSTNKFIYGSHSAHIYSQDTTVSIGNYQDTGRFVFYEIYMEEDGGFVFDDRSIIFDSRIFQGRFSDNTISEISGMDYNDGESINCWDYTKGYYTIVCHMDTISTPWSTPCNLPVCDMRITPRTLCPAGLRNYEPDLANPVNGGNDLLSNSSKKDGNSYVYNLDICWDCSSETTKFPAIGCTRVVPYVYDSIFHFFTFYIAQNSEIVTPVYNYLYEGDATIDPGICADSNNLIDPCRNGNVYCNLKGGKTYTLVITHYDNHVHKLIATPHIKSPNDFAINSYDFGHLKGSETLTSQALPITCHATATPTDPCANKNGVSCYWRQDFVYQFPDTLNRLRYVQRRNLWYTFTVSDATEVVVTALTDGYCKEQLAVYLYRGAYNEDFTRVLSAGLDSTESGLQYIVSNKYRDNNCNTNSVRFTNAGCTENRYFILLESGTEISRNYQIVVTRIPKNGYSNDGDLCPNAISKTTDKPGSYQLKCENICHTYGNSPFEDSTNQELRSSWFKIEITKPGKYDISFRYLNGINIQEFSIYAGNCGALTKVARLNDMFSYFTLSCMGKGSYYIQAIAEHTNLGTLNFGVDIKEGSSDCAPYDFDQPIAQFDVLGGCANDSIELKNLSPQGDDMEYRWYINGKLAGTTLNYHLLRSDPGIVPGKNEFKLIVSNTQSGLSDTIVNVYRNDTTSYFMKIPRPIGYRCHDTLVLSPVTNYPYRMNYEWGPPYTFKDPYSPEQSVTQLRYKKITLTGKSDNCVFHDTLILEAPMSSGIFKDTSICGNNLGLKYKLSGYYSFIVNGKRIDEPYFEVNDTGTYYIQFYTAGCTFIDTMRVNQGSDYEHIEVMDSTVICPGDSVTIGQKEDLLSYAWSNGSEEKFITVNSPGRYILNGDREVCNGLTYTVDVKEDSIVSDFLDDMEVCAGEWFRFTNPDPRFTLVNRQPAADSFIVNAPQLIKITLGDKYCTSLDSALVSPIARENMMFDSTFCIDKGSLTLDARRALTYDWLGQNYFDRFYDVSEYGIYTVARENEQGCKDTITFTVTSDCPAIFYVPNAFSPENEDGLNDLFGPVIFGAYKNYEMLIANRWGEVIYYTTESRPWDGYYMGERVQLGAYLVIIRVNSVRGTEMYKGTVTVVR